jgi:hypothetical protein
MSASFRTASSCVDLVSTGIFEGLCQHQFGSKR